MMNLEPDIWQGATRSKRLNWPIRYGGACLLVGAAAGLWSLSSLILHDPFEIFVLSVVVTARFFGFGPAMFGTALSVLVIDYLAFHPRFSFDMQSDDLARLLIFVFVSLLAASLAPWEKPRSPTQGPVPLSSSMPRWMEYSISYAHESASIAS